MLRVFMRKINNVRENFEQEDVKTILKKEEEQIVKEIKTSNTKKNQKASEISKFKPSFNSAPNSEESTLSSTITTLKSVFLSSLSTTPSLSLLSTLPQSPIFTSSELNLILSTPSVPILSLLPFLTPSLLISSVPNPLPLSLYPLLNSVTLHLSKSSIAALLPEYPHLLPWFQTEILGSFFMLSDLEPIIHMLILHLPQNQRQIHNEEKEHTSKQISTSVAQIFITAIDIFEKDKTVDFVLKSVEDEDLRKKFVSWAYMESDEESEGAINEDEEKSNVNKEEFKEEEKVETKGEKEQVSEVEKEDKDEEKEEIKEIVKEITVEEEIVNKENEKEETTEIQKEDKEIDLNNIKEDKEGEENIYIDKKWRMKFEEESKVHCETVKKLECVMESYKKKESETEILINELNEMKVINKKILENFERIMQQNIMNNSKDKDKNDIEILERISNNNKALKTCDYNESTKLSSNINTCKEIQNETPIIDKNEEIKESNSELSQNNSKNKNRLNLDEDLSNIQKCLLESKSPDMLYQSLTQIFKSLSSQSQQTEMLNNLNSMLISPDFHLPASSFQSLLSFLLAQFSLLKSCSSESSQLLLLLNQLISNLINSQSLPIILNSLLNLIHLVLSATIDRSYLSILVKCLSQTVRSLKAIFHKNTEICENLNGIDENIEEKEELKGSRNDILNKIRIVIDELERIEEKCLILENVQRIVKDLQHIIEEIN